VKRLNWGCGEHTAPGWINADAKKSAGVDLVCDIREGLPLEDNSIDYAVSVHALQELAYPEIVPALREVRRVLRPAGVLRLALPDLQKGIDAYVLGNDDYFKVNADEVRSPGGRFIVHMLWHGHSRTLFTADFIEELLLKADFAEVVACMYRETASGFPQITELDNREEESLYVEATKPVEPHAQVPASYNRPMAKRATKIVDVSHSAEANDHVKGRLRAAPHDQGLTITGWVFGHKSRAAEVEVLAGGEIVGRAPVDMKRPDIAKAFKENPQAETSGFRLILAPDGEGESELVARAVLEDGTRVPIGTVRAKTSRRGWLSTLRRG
jgi:predicted SAM-dependent methyltransferase